MSSIRKKVVLVGDKAVGKTAVVDAMLGLDFKAHIEPTIFDNRDLSFDSGLTVTLSDTSGDEAYDRLRPLSYLDSDLVLLCFAMNSGHSLRSVCDRWVPEIKHILPAVPILLVGTKADLKEDRKEEEDNEDHSSSSSIADTQVTVKSEEGRLLSWSIGATAFLECSAKDNSGLIELTEAIENCFVHRDSVQVKWRKMGKMVTM